MTDYASFLAGKRPAVTYAGPDINISDVHPMLHDWQKEIVKWACKVGRAALWEDTGLGKTVQQLEWARLVTPGTKLVVAPLAVCAQTVREATKLGLDAEYVRDGDHITPGGMYVTNYEMVERFDPADLAAVVLDEASILKQSDGKTRTMLIKHFAPVPYRLACTATPAPNDPEELTSQAEFLGHSSRVNMLAAYFIHDNDGWREKRHAVVPMYRWMAEWAVALQRPSDMGGSDDGYILPGLNIIPHLMDVDIDVDGQLFPTDLGGVGGRAQIRKKTLQARCQRAAELVAVEPDEAWLVWTGMNAEAELMAKLTGGVNVHGSLTPEEKAAGLLGFADDKFKVLVTKPGIASQGLNYQHAARMVFVGLGDSYEMYYQAIRRCYRYGQHRVVDVHVVLSTLEAQIAANIARKERQASDITSRLVKEMQWMRMGIPA